MKRRPVNFTSKGYPNKNQVGTGEAAKRRNPKNENKWHYLVICGIYQLHGEEAEKEGLRRILPGVPTVRIDKN